MFNIFKLLKAKVLDWCLSTQDITIKEFHDKFGNTHAEIYNGDQLKFIEKNDVSKYLVKTPTGYSPIKHSMKTVPYVVYEVILEDGKLLRAADEHLLITADGQEVFVKDLVIGVSLIDTVDGPSLVKSVVNCEEMVNMYDLELDDENHVYYTNGILSHNTITIAIYLLWFAMFNDDKTVLVASNKFSNALEIMQRVQFAYEELPHWLKPGVSEFNKTSMEFDNGSRFFSQATTGDTGRGKALSKMFIDELAFVRRSIQDELWASIAPTLATGGDMIISSTPNGDNELFATLWRGAKLGAGDSNGFNFVEVDWDRHPDRDEAFRQSMIAKIGLLKWNQEFENQFISSDPLLINSMKLQQLRPTKPIFEDRGVKFWGKIDPRCSYYVGVDISVGISGDYSTIQVLEFPSMNQFAEFRSNTISPQQLYSRVKWVLTYLKTPIDNAANGKTPEVYWSFENNGVGASLVALYQNEDKFPDAILLSDKDRTGVVTSAKSKLLSCLELKRLIEKTTMGIRINSDLLLEELKNYISNGKTTYHAKPGATDDLIAAMLIVMNVLNKATDYDPEVFDLMYTVEEDTEYADPADVYGDAAPPMVF